MKMLEKIQMDMASDRERLARLESDRERLENLEAKSLEVKSELTQVANQVKAPDAARPRGNEGAGTQMEFISGREKQLTKGFGSDVSPAALTEFLDHYKLCVEMNQQRNIPGWEDPGYRAKELRFQLQGEAAVYVRQEEAMGQSWVCDDEEIVQKLKDRWLHRDCIELDILEFEEAKQGERETLAQYMQRVKGLGYRAFERFDPNGMKQRIIWRFLDGVREKDVRAEIIRARWMKDRDTPKDYDEVLKIAMNAQSVRMAAGATGSNVQPRQANIGAVTGPPPKPGDKRDRRSGAARSFDCYYCKRRHPGGWRTCDKRKKENPDWEPGQARSNNVGHGSGSNSSGSGIISQVSPLSSASPGGNNTQIFR